MSKFRNIDMKAENSWDGTHTYVWLEPDYFGQIKLLPFYKLYEIMTFLLPHPQRQSHQNFGPHIFLGQHDINIKRHFIHFHTLFDNLKPSIPLNLKTPCKCIQNNFNLIHEIWLCLFFLNLKNQTDWDNDDKQ